MKKRTQNENWPNKYGYTVSTIYLKEETKEQLQQLTETLTLSESELVALLIEQEMKQLLNALDEVEFYEFVEHYSDSEFEFLKAYQNYKEWRNKAMIKKTRLFID